LRMVPIARVNRFSTEPYEHKQIHLSRNHEN
jgi:hypothetical protein